MPGLIRLLTMKFMMLSIESAMAGRVFPSSVSSQRSVEHIEDQVAFQIQRHPLESSSRFLARGFNELTVAIEESTLVPSLGFSGGRLR